MIRIGADGRGYGHGGDADGNGKEHGGVAIEFGNLMYMEEMDTMGEDMYYQGPQDYSGI